MSKRHDHKFQVYEAQSSLAQANHCDNYNMKDYSFQFYFKEIICDIKEITFSISEKQTTIFLGT